MSWHDFMLILAGKLRELQTKANNMKECVCLHALGLCLAISEVSYCVGAGTPTLNGGVAALERDLNRRRRGGGGGET
jgi:hypothetical protein